ncbi:DUF3997 domain-containing protein [Pontibacter ramchanderi]|uniref:Uncharacterized protein DUF3997 n=1 Tax=Pontibacter ramchanderi TaxID=1179743 RepID=A0A2N3UAF7_9BACT|nr:DUF3997 domain-containing protein [Pontibacter ramchanderi]PKV66322.1 uncharacterized protein DUF3997 [Pontibacter ramchanderi]
MKLTFYSLLLLIILVTNACSEGSAVDLGNGYRFDYDPVISSDDAIFGPDENVYAVDGHVTAYNFDSVFIVVEQKPRHVILKDVYLNSDITYLKEEKIFDQSTLRHYWIVDKIKDSRYGPFTEEEYLQKREELGISLELKQVSVE